MAQRIKVSEKDFLIEFGNDERTRGKINDEDFGLDVRWISENRLHVIREPRSYDIELLPDVDGNRQIRVNGNTYGAEVVGKFDELLKKLGMHNGTTGKVSDMKAPMPGLVLEVLVKPGDAVSKGDRLLVLEAMKMEHNITASEEGVVHCIDVQEGEQVEQGTVLIRLEET